ncbi:MAG TPA: hypothetical protein ENO21_03505, partial [Firmicutes bacterium]|nr:hypothetical protein [Bacillota bacterium]
MNGEIFHGSGAILVDTGKRAAALSRPRERKSLEDRIRQQAAELEAVQGRIGAAEAAEETLNRQLGERSQQAAEAE